MICPACHEVHDKPEVCCNCGEIHEMPTDIDDDWGCDWDVLSGNTTRSDPRHPADDPHHLTSDVIGFSIFY